MLGTYADVGRATQYAQDSPQLKWLRHGAPVLCTKVACPRATMQQYFAPTVQQVQALQQLLVQRLGATLPARPSRPPWRLSNHSQLVR